MNNKTRLQLITLLITTTLSTTACQSQQQKSSDSDDIINQISNETGVSTEKIKEVVSSATPSSNIDSIIKDEQTAVGYFENSKNELKELSTKEDKVKYEQEATKYLKNVVDFIFYDKSFNGVTFSSLKDDAKKEIMDSVESTNTILQYSGLKSIVLKGAGDAKEWTLDKIAVGIVVVKELVGEKTYDKATSIAEKLKNKALEKANDVKNAIKEYEATK